jgi:beta-glucosidase-like glycosyl hydrolase
MFGANDTLIGSDAGDVGYLMAFGVATNCAEAASKAIKAGLDQDLVNVCYGAALAPSVRNGSIPIKYVDRAAANVLRAKFAAGLFDGPEYVFVNETVMKSVLDAPEHRRLAYTAAAEGIVLLQNRKSFLPLDLKMKRAVGIDLDRELDLDGISSTKQAAAGKVGDERVRKGANTDDAITVDTTTTTTTTTTPTTNSSSSSSSSKRVARIAVIGPNAGCGGASNPDACDATAATVGGYSNGGAHVVTVLEAVQQARRAANTTLSSVTYARGCNIDDNSQILIPAAVQAAAAADLVILVAQ